MNRRDFMLITAAGLALPAAAQAKFIDYTPGLVRDRLAAGETLFVDFAATWCGTCRAQGRAIQALKSENPAYEQNITFVKVDWDSYKRADLTTSLRIPRRSTLVVLRGNDELGRIVANTSRDAIRSLMDTALQAAVS